MTNLIPPETIPIISVLITQYMLGKKAAFPLGLVLGLTAYQIGVVVVISEFVLMAIVNHIFDLSYDRFRWAIYLRERSERIQVHLKKGKWSSRLLRIGWMGPLTVTALPFAGGVWSGMALARLMVLSSRQTMWSVGIGAVLGCLIFVLAAIGILSIVEIPRI
ncbi:small multi-drug export protein [bacterium]|nr:small multi-drug export protein [bacterium]